MIGILLKPPKRERNPRGVLRKAQRAVLKRLVDVALGRAAVPPKQDTLGAFPCQLCDGLHYTLRHSEATGQHIGIVIGGLK